MTDRLIIKREELADLIQRAVLQANTELLRQLGRRVGDLPPWISQRYATQLLGKTGRGKLERAMAKGLVRFHKRNPESKYGRVMVRTEDVEKLLNNPKI